jgi:signal transduction protein with GAF and PtsI domain
MGENATAAIVAVSLFGALASLAFSINAIARAWVARGRDEAKLVNEPATQLTDVRLARLEQAVDTIALEIERMSEAQRFTARLQNDQGRVAPTPIRRQLSSDTPT